MVPPGVVLEARRTAEFPGDDEQDLLTQAALCDIFQKSAHRMVKRTAKRALIFATLFYLVISFTGGGVSPAVKLANTAVIPSSSQ